MAFTRKALKEMGITEETLEKVMALYGNSMKDYTPTSEIDDIVKGKVDTEVAAKLPALVDTKVAEKLGETNVEELKVQAGKAVALETTISGMKLEYGIKLALAKKNYVSEKAAVALLDMSKVTMDGDKITGLEEQLTEIETANPWLVPTTVTTPASNGMRQNGSPPAKTDEKSYLDDKYKNNPYYKKE